jgi:hypothetical protein
VIDLPQSIDKVYHKATTRRPHEFGMKGILNGKEVPITDYKLRVTALPQQSSRVYDEGTSRGDQISLADAPVQVHLIEVATRKEALLGNVGAIYAVAGAISRIAFAKTQYGDVTQDPLFHLLYDVQDRALSYVEAGNSTQKLVRSAPCMICGLVLPLRNLTVDHQRPQTGGELEAVAKTFRAFGLTEEGPKGPKGQKIMQHLLTGLPPTAVPTQSNRAPLGGSSLNARYTLNLAGNVLYSFVSEAGDAELLQTACLHGLLNLRPACGACNSSRGQQLKFPPPVINVSTSG